MAEALGTALSLVGAVGVLGQIFSGCIKAYSIFTSASNLGRDSERLVCKIRIEEMRLLVWGREWGVVEGKLEAHLQAESTAGNERIRQLATQILSELYKTITDFRRLQDKYGLVQEPTSPNGEKIVAQKTSKNGQSVATDKEKFNMLLKDLKDYNDGLEQLFPSSRLATLHRTWTNELLQQADSLAKLAILEKYCCPYTDLQTFSAASGIYPQLNGSASLKQLRLNLDAKPTSKFKSTVALKIPRPTITISDSDPRRSRAVYHNPSTERAEDVLIEWVDYEKGDEDSKFNHRRRVDDLARMIHSASDRHPDLHTVDCVGYTDDTACCRYGLMYRAPQPSSSTLHALILSNDLRTPDLGDRFRLAHTLAVALWSLHSLEWVHKSVCSFNILFFPSAFSASATQVTASAASIPNIASPCILGFDASRPDDMSELSVASKNPAASDLHRHPASLNGMSRRRYCKSFDIYSLGLVLLEIGLWKVLQTYHRPHYTAERFRDKVVVQNLVPSLGSKAGRLYREVVERCLFAREDLNGQETGHLMEYVVGSLESLRV
ncbi:hypothetical protein D0Z07_3784 [Hyphodiscus hymeniophilus]|uniref:Protein kinase domain-containing protein n=1 Tax=Hyphodiscus hymeniophilus TaxID=353542 RepID=A0A9P7AXZ8_9HELO|nr:hypothetical protein D0Z07_3784 [Hyphodiscus hymeniophilus]